MKQISVIAIVFILNLILFLNVQLQRTEDTEDCKC